MSEIDIFIDTTTMKLPAPSKRWSNVWQNFHSGPYAPCLSCGYVITRVGEIYAGCATYPSKDVAETAAAEQIAALPNGDIWRGAYPAAKEAGQ